MLHEIWLFGMMHVNWHKVFCILSSFLSNPVFWIMQVQGLITSTDELKESKTKVSLHSSFYIINAVSLDQ